MTPADELRQAATKAREVAGAATPGPWHQATTGVECGDHWSVIDYPTMDTVARIPSEDGTNEDQRRPDARHMATFDPPLGLAVADLLDAIAAKAESCQKEPWPFTFPVEPEDHAALTLARLLLATPTGREQ